MLKIVFSIVMVIGLLACFSDKEASPPIVPIALAATPSQPDSIPLGLHKLVEAYPQQELEATENALVWGDGFRLYYADSSTWATFQDSLEQPNLALQLSQVYPKGEQYAVPSLNQDPGRIRVEAFFEKMYGDSKAAVQAQLVTVDFLGTPVQVTTVNDVHKHLKAVVKALQKHPEWHSYCLPTAGTFNWREIAGTNRRSSHSYGIAIDLNVQWANYWRWAVGKKNATHKRPILYKNRLPLGLVALFEQEGFIWGGKWYHYDTMHFEYRPELL